MGLKDVMRYLQQPGSVIPVTPEKITGLQREASFYAGCTCVTPVTPHLGNTQESAQFRPVDEASNDPNLPTDQPAKPAPTPRQSYQEWVQTWQPLAEAYHVHHFGCPVCVAAGKGYGLRCGSGASLWQAYTDAA
jgi:hypothetical protein